MIHFRVALLAVLVVAGVGCRQARPAPRQLLSIFAATSLGPTLEDLARNFEAAHPDVHVEVVLSSSRRACAKVTEQGLPADLVFTADAEVIDSLLVPEVADFTLRFAQNALVLAYSPECPLRNLLSNGTPWQELLATGDYRVGIANPATSPVGHRALLALKLNDLTAPPQLRLGNRISRGLRPEHRRNDASRLVEPLLAHELDAAFIYRSDALQHDLGFVSLNRRVDFSDPRLRDDYAQVSMTLPGSEETVFGSPVSYGLTILRGSKQPELAASFVRYLLSPAGRAQARRHKLPLLPPEQLTISGKLRPDLLLETSL